MRARPRHVTLLIALLTGCLLIAVAVGQRKWLVDSLYIAQVRWAGVEGKRAAARELGVRRCARAAPYLFTLVREGVADVAAGQALTEIAQVDHEHHVEALADDSRSVRGLAASILLELALEGSDREQLLIWMIADGTLQQKKEAAGKLAALGPQAEAGFRSLLKALHDPNREVVLAVTLGLRKSGPKAGAAVPELEALLKGAAPRVRQDVVWTLAEIGPPAVAALERALSDPEVSIKKTAITGLGAIGEEAASAVPKLLELAEERALRTLVIEMLARFGPAAGAAVPTLREALADSDNALSERAMKALESIGQAAQGATPELLAILQDRRRSSRLRYEAAECLAVLCCGERSCKGSTGPPRRNDIVAALRDALKDRDLRLRTRVAAVLWCEARDAELVLPTLLEGLSSKDFSTRREAQQAARDMGPEVAERVPGLGVLVGGGAR